jgi:nicotinic acid mononucleotide adenylyltransferase
MTLISKSEIRKIVKSFAKSNKKIYAIITGGGQSFISDYLSISGASDSFIGATVPYSTYAFDKLVSSIAGDGEKYVSEEAAKRLALVAYSEAKNSQSGNSVNCIGIGATSSIQKDGERIGRVHRTCISICSREWLIVFTGTWDAWGSKRSRHVENEVIKWVIFSLLKVLASEDADVTDYLNTVLGQIRLHFSECSINHAVNSSVQNVLEGKIPFFSGGSVINCSNYKVLPLVVYCGSWNPLHPGHLAIAKIAKEELKVEPIFELSLLNIDKPDIDALEVLKRTKQFIKRDSWIITAAPTYVDKTKALRSIIPTRPIVFVMGADTWNRIWKNPYHQNCDEWNYFLNKKISFLVFPRNGEVINNLFALDILIKNERIKSFNMNVSSSLLRM